MTDLTRTIFNPDNTLSQCVWLAGIRTVWLRWGMDAIPWHTTVTQWGQDVLHREEVMN